MNIEQKILSTLYKQKAFGFNYIDPITIHKKNDISLPNNLESLKKIINECQLCELSKNKTKIFGNGNKNALVMFIGDFSATGDVFIGKSAQIIDNIIKNVLNISKEQVYMTNLIKCIPSNYQTPSNIHYNFCKNFLLKQIEIINPKILVLLGENVYKYILNDFSSPFEQIRGEILNYKNIKLLTTYHPTFLIRNPTKKKEVLNDMLKVKKIIFS